MNITFKKRTVSLILAVIMIFTVFSIGTGAADLPVMPSTDGTWYPFGGVSSYECLENELKIHTAAAQKASVISVTFPKEGGIRVHNESEGFFKPTALKNIKYQKTTGSVVMTADGVKTAVFNYGASEWSIDAYNGKGSIAFSFSSSDIFVGYDDGKYSMAKITGSISDGEVFTGLGERYSGVILNGKSYSLWNTDCWSGGTESYVNVPLLHSTNGYSLFYNSSYGADADIGSSNSEKYSLAFNGPDLDFYIWTDAPVENIKSYTSLTGKPITAPRWAFRYWAGGTGTYWTSEGDSNEAVLNLVKQVIEGYRELGTMPAALYGEAAPSRNKSVYDYLKQNDINLLGWNHPGATWDIKEFNLSILKSLCPGVEEAALPGIRKKDNTSEFYRFSDREWIWGDYSNPNAVTLLTNKMRTYWLWGVRGAMVDFGEYVYDDTYFYNGMYGDEMHNFYAYYYNKAVNEAWNNRLKGNYILFARAGCAGSQKYAANFGGDQQSTFDGLKQAIMGGISISSSGFSVWGSDLGGLHTHKNAQGVPTEELYNRWLQFSTFSPLMRAHGYNRNPWYYKSDATNAAFQKYYWLRENLLDAIYSANIASGKYGTPMMQSMQIAFPENSKLKAVEDQYMFCGDLLVCPVYNEGAASRDVMFPEGFWYDLLTGERVIGGAAKNVAAAVDEIPVYISSGAVLPVTLSEETLRLTDSISGEGRAALLITPPVSEKKTEIFESDTVSTVYTSAPVSGNSFNIKASGEKQADLLVVYGTSAASVICDGTELSAIDGKPSDSNVSGYYTDTAAGCTYIALPTDCWQSITVTDSSAESFFQRISVGSGQTVEDVYNNIFSFSYNHEKRYESGIKPDACFKSLAGFLLERKQYAAINEPWFANEYFSRTASISPKETDGSIMAVKNFNLKASFRVGFNTSKPNGAIFIGFRQNEPGHFFDGYCRFNQNQNFLRITNTGIRIAGGSGVPRGGPEAVSEEDISFDIASKAGDLNGDGAVNIIDLVKLKKNIALFAEYSESADLNGDYKNTAEDIAGLRKRLLGVPGICELKKLIATADAYITVKLSVIGDECTVTVCNGRNVKEQFLTYTAKLEQDAPKVGYTAIGIGDTVSYSIKSIELKKLP